MAERELSGPEKVASFLLSLEEEHAAAVLRHIGSEVLTEVAEAMTRVDASVSTPARVTALKRELAIATAGPAALRPRREDELGSLLSKGVGPQRSREVVERMRARKLAEKPFLELEQVPVEQLARVLAQESPAVCALVLAHLEPELSAAVLSALDPDVALGVVKRMASLVPPGIEMLRSIAASVLEGLKRLADSPVEPDPEKRLRTIAAMLNLSAPGVGQSVMQSLAEEDETTAKGIREKMFTWDDLAAIDKRAMQKILGSIDTRTLSIALKACKADVENNVLANLSARVRAMVAEERELAGALPLAEVLAAREQVMTTVRGMIESGEFSPSRGGEELVS